MANRSFKYRIYPTSEQTVLINKTIGCCRFMYNALLADCKKQYEKNGKSTVKSYKTISDQFEWMKDVDTVALNSSRRNLSEAYQNFFKSVTGKRKGKKLSMPKFHVKQSAESYTTYATGARTAKNWNDAYIKDGKLRLPKVGLVKVVWHRLFSGNIKHITISRTATGKYFVSLCTDIGEEVIEKKEVKNVVGIDMSFKDLAVYSDGERATNPKFYRQLERRLAHAQRNLSRKIGSKKGEKKSSNWIKARRKVNAIYEKITNARKDFLDKESRRIADKYDVAVVEDINLQAMANKGMKNGKSVNDMSFGKFRTMLEYKMYRNGGEVVKVDRFFPSSQLCSNCGFKNVKIKNLAIRNWECPKCHTHHDRDINAAINLRNQYVPPLQRELKPVESLDSSSSLLFDAGGESDEAGKLVE